MDGRAGIDVCGLAKVFPDISQSGAGQRDPRFSRQVVPISSYSNMWSPDRYVGNLHVSRVRREFCLSVYRALRNDNRDVVNRQHVHQQRMPSKFPT